MEQQSLPLKEQKFIWKLFLFKSPDDKNPCFVSGIEAHTDSQAKFLAGKLKRISYDEKSSLAKKIGIVNH